VVLSSDPDKGREPLHTAALYDELVVLVGRALCWCVFFFLPSSLPLRSFLSRDNESLFPYARTVIQASIWALLLNNSGKASAVVTYLTWCASFPFISLLFFADSPSFPCFYALSVFLPSAPLHNPLRASSRPLPPWQ
jgi:hypothetical protein